MLYGTCTTFAQSIAEPPPRETMTVSSSPPSISSIMEMPSRTLAKVGFGSTVPYVAHATLAVAQVVAEGASTAAKMAMEVAQEELLVEEGKARCPVPREESIAHTRGSSDSG